MPNKRVKTPPTVTAVPGYSVRTPKGDVLFTSEDLHQALTVLREHAKGSLYRNQDSVMLAYMTGPATGFLREKRL